MAAPSEYVLESIRIKAEFTLYRARQHGNPSPLLVVAPAAEQPLPQSLRRLEHEYSLAAELEPAWAAMPLALTRHEGRTILVLADPGGEPLDLILERARPLDLPRILGLAINLAAALGQAHQRGLIHKDIKPENILFDNDGDAGHVWLTGFGIASRLPRERHAPTPPEIIVGTLAYMSPEQTGRMNRSLDTRSDLYSLGVTFYEMLTGALPFTAADPLEWVHCHIARQPVPPADRHAVPERLSAIVMKLLAKNAEERYQTAAGLEADLRHCLLDWQSHGRIDPFPLAANDSSNRLLIPEKLYGREREVNTLLAAFDRLVEQGAAELVLVSGYSGVGKSSLVNELHKVLVPQRGLFAAGKFDQYKRDVPYATLAQAFQTLVRQILVMSEADVDHWRHALVEALGANGQLMVNLIPELEFVIGKQPPVADLPPQEARGRFQLVFRRFLGAFATAEHPLALFLDDLQWLDTATLELLERLITDPEVRHVLLIGAYRDNEVSSSHPLMRTLDAIREAGTRTQEIVLKPLSLDDIHRLVVEALRCSRKSVGPLAQLVHEKTGGNPFFAIQFLTALAEEGLLVFDWASGWIANLARIHAKGYSDSVADLMLEKLRRLPPHTQAALQQLASLGNAAGIATLSTVFGHSEDEIHTALLDAVHTGLILRLEASYAFPHDRIQEAAYALIPESERPEVHFRIGRALLASLTEEGLAEHLFDVASQLNRGSALLIDHDEKVQVAAINLSAGRRAKASAAYASAREYFAAGMALLDESDWTSQYELTFGLSLERAECELLTADMPAAEGRLTMLAQRARSRHDFAVVTRLQVTLYTSLDRSNRAIEVFLDYLRRNGTDWSPHPARDEVTQEYNRIWSLVGDRRIEDLVDLPPLDDPDVLDMLDVCTEIVHPAMFFDENLSTLVVFRMVNLCLEHGNCDASCFGYIWFGMFAGPRFNDYTNGFRFGQLGFDLVERGNLTRYQARTYVSFGTLTPWAKHAAKGRELIRRAFDVAYRTGDLTFSAYSWHSLIANYLAVGDSLSEVEAEAEKGLSFVRKAGSGLVTENCMANLGLIRTLRGLTPTFGCFDSPDYNESDTERRYASNPLLALSEFFYWTRKLQARFFAGDYTSAVEASQKAHQLLWTAASQVETGDYRFYAALANAAAWHSASSGEKQTHFAALNDHHRQLAIWALHCPANFETRAALVSAEIARIEGRVREAEDFYEVAIRSAHDNGFAHCEAVSNECAAQFYSARGFTKIAFIYLRDARDCYLRWGASAKVRQLEERYPKIKAATTSSETGTIHASVDQLDLATVIRVSEAISGEIEQEKLIDALVRAAIEHAGAERCLLVIVRSGELQIEAEATTGPGGIEVAVRETTVAPDELPQSVLHYVIRTQECVLLDDASSDNVYSKDEYVRRKRSRSVLCLPIVRQAKLVGALYLENNLTPCAFTPDRVTILRLLASQAAISLENAGLYSDLQLQAGLLQRLPVSAWTLTPDGTPDFVNQVWLEFSGQTLDFVRSHPEAWMTAVHPHDREAASKAFRGGVRSGQGFAIETRSLRAHDATYRWHLQQAVVLRDAEGKVLRFVGTTTDIDDQKRAEEKLRESEYEARLTVDSIPGMIAVTSPTGNLEMVSRQALEFFGRTIEELRGWGTNDTIHPEDLPGAIGAFTQAIVTGNPYEFLARFRRWDGVYRWFQDRGFPLRDRNGNIARWYLLITDIDDQKRAEEALRESEHESRLIVDSIPGLIAVLDTSGELERVSQPILDYFGKSLEECRQWAVDDTIHPDDRPGYLQTFERSFTAGDPVEYDAVRLRRFDGVYRWFDTRGLPLRDRQGHIVRWYFLLTEIDDKKRAEDKIRQSEKEARQLLDMSPLHITELGPDGARLYTNLASLYYYGITLEEWQDASLQQVLHPQDAEIVTKDLPVKLQSGAPFEYEARLRRNDGQYRWFHYRCNPMLDEQGCTTRWYAAGTDIEELKLAGQRLQEENVSLREEIDKASMFEEIVGTSAPLKKVLSRVSKVAPTDSSVLVTGETGTGKELVARAIHRRSRRSSHAFVSVNCAVIPRDLIASELFGHEKGAFTGATQRRLGRFELAEKGTIFLDEVGELPAETQIALLRVLQEHEFERIGGTGSIRSDVRVIAATNRDLEAAIAAGTFRSDLYYRLNVFPIELPTLRERNEDIPLLVTYFLNRYARKAGRHFTAVDKKSLDLLQSYPWPGNIRELQNVIERSVIVSDGEIFSVDESWLSRQPRTQELPERLIAQEKEMIEAALRECGGRVSGTDGAAARLGMPGSTLESKIKSLKIDKHRFRRSPSH